MKPFQNGTAATTVPCNDQFGSTTILGIMSVSKRVALELSGIILAMRTRKDGLFT